MKANRSTDTRPELLLRRALHSAKLRYRKERQPEPDLLCSADVVFFRHRVAVFIDGCFWHGCPDHWTPPKRNTDWWVQKIQNTIRRDARNRAALSARGWTVLRFWEHELVTVEDAAVAVTKVRKALRD